MSGFGIRAFKKQTEEEHKNEKDHFIKYVVYGENTFGVLTFLRLNRKFPGEVKLICNNPFFKEEMLKEWNCSINSVRSEEVAQALMSLTSKFEIFPSNQNVVFYKDTKFHKFGGRAKPHELKPEEMFFTKPSYEINLPGIFETEDYENLDTLLKEHQLHKILSEIEVATPSDLVEKTNFILHTGDNEKIRCEQLYFCESPKSFLSLVSNKDMLNDSVQAYAAGIRGYQAIGIHVKAQGQISEQTGTFVLPQSMTHEWGSFILEIKEYDPELNLQEMSCLSFIAEDDLQEEDLAKKIKLLKRVVERVFPELAKTSYSQDIKFFENYLQTGTDDTQYEDLKDQAVRFLGQSAAINHPDAEKFSYLSRGIYAIMSEIQL